MENIVNILQYNSGRDRMVLPEYGRGVQKMVQVVKEIPDRDKRSEQARAVVRVMELLNPSIRQHENWDHTLWDHFYMIADYDIDIDAPYPVPPRKDSSSQAHCVPIQKKPLRASHYGRNIESIIDLISEREEGPQKTEMIRDLAIYMRTQYLIWNKNTVKDETIFKDIERLSDGKIKVPEGLELSEMSASVNLSRPTMSINPGGSKQQPSGKNRKRKRNKNNR